MELNEAIAHEREEAKEYRKTANGWYAGGCSYAQAEGNVCLEFAKEHEQLALWLEELAEWRKLELIYANKGVFVYMKKESEGE